MADPINNLGSVRAWLRTCPSVASNAPFGADFLGDDPDKFALCSVPTVVRTRENIMGETVKAPVQEQNFAIDYRATYGEPVQNNLDTLGLLQAIHDWIVEQNNAGNFPAWQGGTIKSIMPTMTPAMMDVRSATARYRVQIKVIYHID